MGCRLAKQERLFTEAEKQEAEEQIRDEQKEVDYSIREYPLEVIVDKYQNGIEDDTNEIFIPDYQRNFVWPEERQSRFIESILIGLPIPYLFVADVSAEDEELSGRLEVVDGTQRLRTLASFMADTLTLEGLARLTKLNEQKFSDLLPSRQRRFKRSTIRVIELTEKTDEATRRDMFDRINSGGMKLSPMEVRRGTKDSELLKLVRTLASDQKLQTLAPLPKSMVQKRAYEELALRFFAYLEDAEEFRRSVIEFINEFVDRKDANWSEEIENAYREEWTAMLDFVEQNFEHGFKKAEGRSRTPMVRFEAISVGVALALRENPDLNADPAEIAQWSSSEEFDQLVSSDGANSRPKLKRRIEYVRDQLLNRQE